MMPRMVLKREKVKGGLRWRTLEDAGVFVVVGPEWRPDMWCVAGYSPDDEDGKATSEIIRDFGRAAKNVAQPLQVFADLVVGLVGIEWREVDRDMLTQQMMTVGSLPGWMMRQDAAWVWRLRRNLVAQDPLVAVPAALQALHGAYVAESPAMSAWWE